MIDLQLFHVSTSLAVAEYLRSELEYGWTVKEVNILIFKYGEEDQLVQQFITKSVKCNYDQVIK